MTAIDIQHISKSFNRIPAISEISLKINTGELFGLIGPDGAGKTTLFKILTTLLMPDRGDAWIEGFHTVREFRKIRRIIGYMPGRFSLYPDLSVEENLNFFATIFNTSVKDNYHLIADIYGQIEPYKTRRAGNLSGGMKQKLALSCALIHEPKVLFLDEPTTGVDAVSRAEFWEMLERLREKGITILVSTPYMDEASLCERIALIQNGEILSIDTPERITESYAKPLYAVTAHDSFRLLKELRQQPFTYRVEPFGDYLHLTTAKDIELQELYGRIKAKGHEGLKIKPIQASIEDVFLDLMQ